MSVFHRTRQKVQFISDCLPQRQFILRTEEQFLMPRKEPRKEQKKFYKQLRFHRTWKKELAAVTNLLN